MTRVSDNPDAWAGCKVILDAKGCCKLFLSQLEDILC